MKIDTLTQKDIDNFKKLDINKTLVEKFEKNKEILDELKRTEDFKLEFFENDKTIDNIEIGKECINKGLILTPLDKCSFIIPTEIVNMILKYRDNIKGLAHKKPENFLILYPSKYSNLENKEIPIEDIGVYYSPYFLFTLREFSVELLEMKNKPKEASIFKQADTLLGISRGDINSFKNEFIASIVILLMFGLISGVLYIGYNDILISSIPLLIYFVMLAFSFYESVIKPLNNKDEIVKKALDIEFLHYLKETYFN